MPISRRRFLGVLGGGLAAVSAPGYARYVEPGWLDFSEITIALGRNQAANPIKILHLSDLHLLPRASRKYLHGVFDLGISKKPDLIFVTGDFITRTYGMPANYAPTLQRLTAAAPTYACMGNHDGGLEGGFSSSEPMRDLMRESGIRCPHNATITTAVRGRTLEITGLGDLWSGEFLPQEAFPAPTLNRNERIVLSHNPDSKEPLKDYSWDLMLSGHTHGGQIGIPLIRENFAPVFDKRFIEGLHTWNERQIYISRGVGNLFGVRFLCRPQATLITLV